MIWSRSEFIIEHYHICVYKWAWLRRPSELLFLKKKIIMLEITSKYLSIM